MTKSQNGKRTYLYKQLSDKLRKEILEGVYKPDERLPSIDDLSEQYEMNRITVKRALSELRAEGLIYAIPAQGTYVSPAQDHTLKSDTGRKTIGLILCGVNTHGFGPYHVDVITGIQEGIGEHDWNLMLVALNDPSEDRNYEHVMQTQLDAAIYVGVYPPTLLRRLVRNGPPAVLIDQQLRAVKCDMINLDNFGGAYEMTQHLVELGHRRIACVEGFKSHVTTERKEGVLTAWQENNLPPSEIQWIEGDFRRESGERAAKKVLTAKKRATAVFCFNDEMAAGMIQGLFGSGTIAIPEDISVVGFDDISWSQATYPQFTTVQVQRFAMGHLSVQRIHEAFTSPGYTPTCTSVGTKLIKRNSTRSLHAS